MMKIDDKTKCCGCTACYNICPTKSITMKPDFEGFLYPYVEKDTCVQCGLCESVCPELNGYKKEVVKEVYAVRHKNNRVLDCSTSGGAFTAFANTVIDDGGIVFGVGYDKDFHIVHMEVEKGVEGLWRFRGSKYVQSELGESFAKVRDYLMNGRVVLFSGTSCQIAGLTSFLQKDYENLLTIEVICHGTPSPLLWEKYLDYQNQKYKSQPKTISFRKKTYGYHSGTMEIMFENGKKYTGSARVDFMLKSFFSEISSRPSCYTCMCKGMKRPADLSIYDCWHAEKLVSKLKDDDRGYTNVLVNTTKGARVFSQSKKDFEYYLVDTEQAVKLDGVMILNYPPKHNSRDVYYTELNQMGLEETINKLIPISRKDYAIEKSKVLFYHLGLMKFLRKVK